MSDLVVTIVLAAALAWSVWREPRRLRNGVLLTLLIVHLLLWVATPLGELGEYRSAIALLVFISLTAVFLLVLAVALILNGRTMMRRESRRPANLLSLAFGLLLLAVLVLDVVAVAGGLFELSVVMLFLSLPATLLGFLMVSFLLWSWVYGWSSRKSRTPIEAVIVLGAGLKHDGTPTKLLAARLDTAAQVLHQSRDAGTETIIVTSGGRGHDEKQSEASAMAIYLRGHGVPDGLIVTEGQSRTTDENLEFSARLLRARGASGPFAVVTNNFHAFRAALLMRRHGLPGRAVGAPTARYFWPSAVLREFVAVLRDHRILVGTAVGLATLPLVVFLVGKALSYVT